MLYILHMFPLCACVYIADCVDGDVMLQDGTHPSNGRVEICQYGIWQSVCSSHWDQNDAVVICRQLGYDSEGILDLQALAGLCYLTKHTDIKVTYVFGSEGPVLLSDIRCTGTEEKLHTCPNVTIASHSCDENSNPGVICTKDLGL